MAVKRHKQAGLSDKPDMSGKQPSASAYLSAQLRSRAMPKIAVHDVDGLLDGWSHYDHSGEPKPRSKETL